MLPTDFVTHFKPRRQYRSVTYSFIACIFHTQQLDVRYGPQEMTLIQKGSTHGLQESQFRGLIGDRMNLVVVTMTLTVFRFIIDLLHTMSGKYPSVTRRYGLFVKVYNFLSTPDRQNNGYTHAHDTMYSTNTLIIIILITLCQLYFE